MRFGSLFSGIGGFDIGFERAGMRCAWHSEIDKSASAILRYRWPHVPNLGDVTKIDGAAIEPVDVICGGFPCQDLSVAGKRRGFGGERSVLAFEFLRIVREMREATNGRAPAFIVLENVPGLFSSRGGRDFGALLDALGELGPVDIAWRVLDSRYFGVAQRRRRVFVVVDFGGERCDEILALTEGLRGDSPARGAAREDVAGTLGGGSAERGWCDDLDRAGAFVTDDVAFPVLSREGKGPASSVDSGNIVVTHSLRADGFDASEDGTGRGTPIVPVAFRSNASFAEHGLDVCGTLNAINQHAVAFHENQRGEITSNDTAGTLKVGGGEPGQGYPAIAIRTAQTSANGHGIAEDAAHTLDCVNGQAVVASGVRRLTPRECERLQGFPDDWTAIPGMADGPRYKCLGNAVTVNVAEWIGRRLAEVSQ